ncbi:hypothetical protein SAM23877_6150 [Streptomyces ambofaciens ATCC 23877]|uniref:Uncharacterized protein n=1 Tax=Streptomyces ambofaciens (strain ATCC 23877 / 3486 / DSM 40053 / JCM 4204 / NBRC 12836 / NRRL B-2516) TaxID=278992 RepID=A0A0K2B1E3_STRA7|nr:hypothetical protein [Streptomyces ambofaciens]AKZ59195.1 hypothetical protein SAM23877_6150 [Streptomyces ambofaciens ATCC 23877]WNA15388.1 hypothetical protein SAMYPH_57 [Streptomyces phage Samy]
MGVFDGGTHRVRVLTRDGDESDHYPDDVRGFVATLRKRSDVKAFETVWVHFATGDVVSDLSHGDIDGLDEEEAE